MSDVILETTSLTKEFKGFTAVSDVNLSVRRGSIHALIGPNGAGKTTCFNLLTKFLEPTSGVIRFNGHDITREQPAQIARRGVIRSFQISAVFPHLTLMENVRLGLQRKLGTSYPLLAQRAHAQPVERPRHAIADRSGPGGHGRRGDRQPAVWPQARAGDRHHAVHGARTDAARRAYARHGPRRRGPRHAADQESVSKAAPS